MISTVLTVYWKHSRLDAAKPALPPSKPLYTSFDTLETYFKRSSTRENADSLFTSSLASLVVKETLG